MATEFYSVWLIKERLTIPDPEETTTRYHTYLFVQKPSDASPLNGENAIAGWIHEVAGDIVTSTGMRYVHKPVLQSPEFSDVFHAKRYLGRVNAGAYPENVDSVCRSIKPPGCQKKFNTTTMKYEAVVFGEGDANGGWRFYRPGEKRKAYFKCTEWVEQKVIPKLVEDGILTE
ncbi:hypothetical protein LOZ53_002835 [Ophidiomyces ophidiicola]|nr:hypothetical protein LOZ55_005070 [Ophidiomyces ophidiicola]KAI1985949.1 hypothetical protein LOZ54_004057 [Ophidiomyces ophidiicola]KAI1991521.1 hypothetical protein LOZ53_002835 [Ophidiomyces ophidiicola]KAI2003249.1 hypothetical protein LOZ51_000324 [Ophidiomyces ophidiicola]